VWLNRGPAHAGPLCVKQKMMVEGQQVFLKEMLERHLPAVNR
jgi:hypothetical protein